MFYSLVLLFLHYVHLESFLLEHEKNALLLKYLNNMVGSSKVIIFCATKRGTEEIYRFLDNE